MNQMKWRRLRYSAAEMFESSRAVSYDPESQNEHRRWDVFYMVLIYQSKAPSLLTRLADTRRERIVTGVAHV